MFTRKCIMRLPLVLLLVVTGGSCVCGQELVEEVPSIVEREVGVGNNAVSIPELETYGVAVVIRIPDATITKSLNREFQNTEAVQREVLGTRSHGQAKCHGAVTCTLEDNPKGAAICCRIAGTVQSETCGTNGPAIIHSEAKTSYVAFKRIAFNGVNFISSPATLTLSTELNITGIDSSLPRLRGRIVRRVATRRAQQSHAQAEAITALITREELMSRIDKEFDSRISDLNHKLGDRLSIIKHFRETGNEVFIRSFKDSIEIGLVTAPMTRNDVAIHQVPIGESIELWIGKGPAKLAEEKPLAQMPALTGLIGQAPHWLATYFTNNPQLSKLDDKTVKIKRHDDWIVIQLQD